ncbi:MAG: hypothetical protein NT080_10110 [Spirochaetes bacterium]|nr:hypothetical protein [Spirochaetota bacterium]
MRFPILAIFFLASFAASVPAQDEGKRFALIPGFVDLSTEVLGSGAFSGVLARSISLELERAGYGIVRGDGAETERDDMLSAEAAMRRAAGSGADIAIIGFYAIEGDEIVVGLRAYDVLSDRAAIGLVERGEGGVGIFDTIDRVAALVAARARETLKPLGPAEIVVRSQKVRVVKRVVDDPSGRGAAVLVAVRSPDEGAGVWAGPRELGTVRDGSCAIEAKAGTQLSVTLKLADHYDRKLTIDIVPEMTELRFPALARIRRFDAFASWCGDLPLGIEAGARWYPVPDRIFLGASVTAAWLSPEDPYARLMDPTGTADPGTLGRLSIQAGWHPFSDYDSPVRLSGSLRYYAERGGLSSFPATGNGTFLEVVAETSSGDLDPFLGVRFGGTFGLDALPSANLFGGASWEF